MKPDITLIFPPSPFLINQDVFPPLGIFYLSAYLRQHGFTTQCLDFGLQNDASKIDSVESELVGVSITTPQRFEAFKIVSRLKELGKTVIAGGAHATYKPQECLDAGCDYAIQGEGEIALLQFMKCGPPINRIISEQGVLDINSVPFPDRSTVDDYNYTIDGHPATMMISSRGCPWNCSFCARITKKCRMQHAFRTVREILYIHCTLKYNAFVFVDDVFTQSKERLQQMVSLLDDYDFKFRCFSRTNIIDEEICSLLVRLGVVEVGLGVESGSDEVLARNLKGTTRNINTKAVRLLHDYGIRAKAFLIVGLPGETHDTIRSTCSWIEEAEPDDIDISVLQPYPGSQVFENSEMYGIQFDYNENLGAYKGTPGKYHCTVRNVALSSEEIVYYRDTIEYLYKKKDRLK